METDETVETVEIEQDRGLSALVDVGSFTQLADAYTFTEGPVWVAADQSLLFSDIPSSVTHRWRDGDPVSETTPPYREGTRGGNGMTLDADGNVLCCEQSGRRVVRFPLDDPTAVEVIAETFDGSRLNSPNDVVVHARGLVFFTDPIYGLGPGGEGKEQPHNGVYRIDPDGTITLIDDRFQQPNGLVFAPDGQTLYIGDSQQLVIRRFTLQDDGSITGGAIFADMRRAGHAGGPDGMTIDTDGRLWATGPGGIWVYEADGTPLGMFTIPHQPANVCFGGADGRTLFITAETSVYRIETTVTGVIPGPAGTAVSR